MAEIDEFIPCLMFRKGQLYRHFVHRDDIETLDDPVTRAGKIRHVMVCREIPEDGRATGVAYCVWARITHKCRKDVERINNYPTFVARIKNWMRYPNDYPEMIIMKFESAAVLTYPLFIGPNDIILNSLQSHLSTPLKNWMIEFKVDEFEPKDTAPMHGVDIDRLALDSDEEDEIAPA
jgi:hypothetical protein